MILDKIAAAARIRAAKAKEKIPEQEIKRMALQAEKGEFLFEEALRREGVSFICEVKKASPSKGVIAEQFPYLEIAKQYEEAGAAAISVLTEPDFFMGSDLYLKEIKAKVKLPLLRKDFTVDAYQIYEAKVIGADAVLLICSLLDTDTLREYLKITDSLGLSALVEAHTKEEIEAALDAGAKIIGVNNRNLKTFEVDLDTCIRLRESVPKERLFVAESGIKTPEDVKKLTKGGVDAVLIGETLMKSNEKKELLSRLRGEDNGM